MDFTYFAKELHTLWDSLEPLIPPRTNSWKPITPSQCAVHRAVTLLQLYILPLQHHKEFPSYIFTTSDHHSIIHHHRSISHFTTVSPQQINHQSPFPTTSLFLFTHHNQTRSYIISHHISSHHHHWEVMNDNITCSLDTGKSHRETLTFDYIRI